MKALLLLLPALASASPALDALLGTHQGHDCYLKVTTSSTRPGEIDFEFTDSMSWRTLWNVREPLEQQLDLGASTLVFHHDRRSLGDRTIDLSIRLKNGRPASMRGLSSGWGDEAEVACDFFRN